MGYNRRGEDDESNDIEYIDNFLQDKVLPNIVETKQYTSATSDVLSFLSVIIAFTMFVIGIISIIKIGWLVGLFMILFSILVGFLILLIAKVSDLSLHNHMFLSIMYNDFRGFFGNIKVVDERTKFISRNEPCPCGSGKKYKKCCGI